MKYKVHIYGGNDHYRVDINISTDETERMELLERFARKNKYQLDIEVIT